jgi:DNA-binding NarL/FixJ family response regulator
MCESVAEALAWLSGREADFALVDLGLPDGSGLEVIRELVARHRGCEVLVLSIFGDEANVLAAIAAGAGGYLLKDGELGSFGDHLSCLRTGGSPLSPRIARTLIQLHRAPPSAATAAVTAPAPPLLSDRELEVLTGIAKGFSYGEVATSLGVSTNTVRTHIRHLYEKLSVNSRSEAVYEYNRMMRELGLSQLE